ncbi:MULTISPECIES: DUF4123 domain-containing protein [Pseudomonas]|uniref:DUF4123 domain-containing protein n=1 Tax=Pseudomonas TaxID=286 RepID=UPI0022642162|nr:MULTISPECIES: DUF4123 domain-containing protein [Pseudomonas]MDC7816775.1 DUF4123 domain-containing protein [Pseudomonas sp. BLCC-B112]
MMIVAPGQWMAEQLKSGHSLCLILDSEGAIDTRQALLKHHDSQLYRSVYSETQVADLADSGPFIFLIDNLHDEGLKSLLKAPERNWGWLASIRQGELSALTQHWRERLISGERPHQALYRFHDNRVLSRALGHIAKEALPEYLGPAVSVCYWQGTHWAVIDNPAPGQYPTLAYPSWLSVPAPQERALGVLHANLYRYLWAERSDDLLRLSQQQDPHIWLTEQLTQAQQWGWSAPEQVHFLVLQNLNRSELPLIKNWQPRADETPAAHFERLFNEVKFWSGEGAV